MEIPAQYRICSAKQCRTMDNRTIKEFGIDGFTLMEVAGTKAAEFIRSKTNANQHGLIICGKGNNAGDALVVARLLGESGYKISLYFLADPDALSPETAKNFELLQNIGWNLTIINEINEIFDGKYDFIVDGMLGIGLNNPIREPFSSVIKWVNNSDITVFAMDIPTGLHADTGKIMGDAIKADYTLTFGAYKKGFYFNEGPLYTGHIQLCEIPVPNKYKNDDVVLINEKWVHANTPKLSQRAHKYDAGVLYIIAGSEGLTGAAILAAKSAWQTGLGAVVLITPKALMPTYDKNLIQVIKKSVGAKKDAYFKVSHAEMVLDIMAEKTGDLLIGPGLGRDEETIEFIQLILKQYTGNIVIDADALFALSKSGFSIKPKVNEWIITPHPGEFKQLFGKDIQHDTEKMEVCQENAVKHHITIMAKGMPGIIAGKNGKIYLSDYNTKMFNRAGFGDVLAGKISANLLKYKNPILSSAIAMLDGKKKAEELISNGKENVEPLDII